MKGSEGQKVIVLFEFEREMRHGSLAGLRLVVRSTTGFSAVRNSQEAS